MISEGDYFFRGAERLSWGFATPNYLGAFLAGVLPITWGLLSLVRKPQPAVSPPINPRKRQKTQLASPPTPGRRRYWTAVSVLTLVEAALWAALGATASRGAAVAALAGAILWDAYRSYSEGGRWQQSLGWIGLRLFFCVAGFAVFSFGGRIAPGYLAQDASIGNRWLLWGGGAALCYGSPWTGWGAGESGVLFTQWLQPIDRPQEYKTMVNSYLHLAVERGLPSLAGVLAAGAAFVGWPLAHRRALVPMHWAGVVRGAACVWATWVVANVFSTLFDEPRLWYLPGIATAALCVSLFFTGRSWQWRWWGRGILAAGLGVPLLIWGIGACWQWRETVRVRLGKAGTVQLSRPFSPNTIRWGVMPDTVVLGEKYGHELRRWAASADADWSAEVFDIRRCTGGSGPGIQPERWIVFGDAVERIDQLKPDEPVVIVHPRGIPPKTWHGRGVVLLNQIDEDGSSAQWEDWAGRAGLRVLQIADTGIDARAVWPQSFLSQLGGQVR